MSRAKNNRLKRRFLNKVVKTGDKAKKEYNVRGISLALFSDAPILLILEHRGKMYECDINDIEVSKKENLICTGHIYKTKRESVIGRKAHKDEAIAPQPSQLF